MVKYTNISKIMILTLLGAIGNLMISCSAYDTPKSINSPAQRDPDPVISSMQPDSAHSGIMQLHINGENFSSQVDKNFVYFGNTQASVISAASSEVIVERPVSLSGAQTVKIVVQNAYGAYDYGPYHLEPGFSRRGAAGNYNSFMIDADENIYLEVNEIVYKITPDNSITELANIGFKSSCMRIGADSLLYIQRNRNTSFYRMDLSGNNLERFTRIKKSVTIFDFDQNGYIYSGDAKNGLYITGPDGTGSAEFEGYQRNYAIPAIRVFDGFVYLLVDSLNDGPYKAVFKHEITGNGELGERQIVFELSSAPGYSDVEVFDLTLSEDGKILVAADNTNPILVIKQDGSSESLYSGLLPNPITKLVWGSGNYLYFNLTADDIETAGIFRLIMGNRGAPYLGRD